MNNPERRDNRRARTVLILFLVIFCFGRFTVWMRRPVYPEAAFLASDWSPPNGMRVVNAVDSPLGGIHFFDGGTSIGKALESLEVKVDQHRSLTVLPRASVLEKTPGGWTVRTMTQTERWIWRIPMNLNSSSKDDFRRIPGIGPVLARKIARYVSERVWIPNVDSLLRVKGVGTSKLESLKKYLEVEGVSTKK